MMKLEGRLYRAMHVRVSRLPTSRKPVDEVIREWALLGLRINRAGESMSADFAARMRLAGKIDW